MKKFRLRFTKPIIHMIIRMMIIFLVFGSYGMSAYSQIATTTPASRCGAGTVTLRATAGSGTIKWFTVPFYGTAIPTGVSSEGTVSGDGTTFTTKSMSVTKTYYVDAVDAGNCSLNTNQARKPVIATISAGSIQAAIFYTSNTFCKSLSGDQLVTQTGTAGGVYSATDGGLTLDSSTGAITPGSSNNGTYTVTYHITTPADGCTEADATTQVKITTTPITPVIRYAETPTTPISYCTTAGTINVAHTGASGGTYSASPSGLTIDASTGIITTATSLSGTYTVTYFVPGSGGCDAMTAQATGVTILKSPTATILYATPFCKNSESQPVTLTRTGDYGTGSFTCIPPEDKTLSLDASTGAINPSLSDVGTYTVTYTLASVSPCTQITATTSVEISPATTATLSGGTTICSGGSADLSVAFTGTSPWSFTFTDGSTPVTRSGITDNPYTLAVSPASTRTYSLTAVSDANCSGTGSGTANVIVTAAPVALFEYSGTPYCNTGEALPTFLGGSAGEFSASSTDLHFVSQTTGKINLASSAAGSYTITNTIVAADGCLQVEATAQVTINPLPTATLSLAGDAAICNGSSTTLSIALTGTAPWSFTYTNGTTPTTITGQNTTPYTVIKSPIATTTYSLTAVSDANCDGTYSGTAAVTVTNTPVALFSYTGSPYCNSGTASPEFSGGGVAGSFSASPAGLNVDLETGDINLEGSEAGDYIVTNTIAAEGGCSEVVATANVTVTKLPVATFSYAAAYCKNDENPLPTMGTGAKGSFTATTGLVFVDASTGQVNMELTPVGSYTITNTIAAAGGCGVVTATAPFEIKALPAALAGNNRGFCSGLTTTTLGGTAVSGSTYSWTASPADATLATHNTEANPTVSPAATTTYTLVETNAAGCISSNTVMVGVYTLPPTNAISGTSPICAGTAATTFSVANRIMTSYLWTYTGTGSTINSSTSYTTTIDFSNVATSGTLTLTETTNGCSTQNTKEITVNPLPLATAEGTQSICSNATATIGEGQAGSANGAILWTEDGAGSITAGETTLTPTYTAAAGDAGTTVTLTMTVTSSHASCSSATATATYTVNVYSQFTSGEIETTGQTICYAGTPTVIGSTTVASGGNGTITYNWESSLDGFATAGSVIGGASSATYTPPTGLTATTSYRRYAKDVTCNSTATVSTGTWTVTVYGQFTSGTIETTGESICYAGTPTTTIGDATPASGGNGTITYSWESSLDGFATAGSVIGGASSATYTPPTGLTATTNYRRYAKDVTCNSTATVSTGTWTVTVYGQFTSGTIETTGQTICSGGNPTVIGSTTVASGGHGTITYAWESSLTEDFASPSALSSSNAATYTPAAELTVTTWYRRLAYDATCNLVSTPSTGTWLVTVNPGLTYYLDNDGDGYGNPSVTESNCTGPSSGYVANSMDCFDTDALVHPVSVAEIAGGASTVCVGSTTPAFTDATPDGTWSIVSGTGTASINVGGFVTGVTAGTVTVKYTNASWCVSEATTTLTVQSITVAPLINTVSSTETTQISGTSTEGNGTSIEIFNNESSLGTTTVTGISWTKIEPTPLTSGWVITAKATATGKCVSVASNAVTEILQ